MTPPKQVSAAEPETKPRRRATAEPEPESEPEPDPESEAEPESEPEPDPESEAEPERGAAPIDGRTARATRTRTAIVDALLGLLEEDELQPTASRIAERAGISLRLIYHHFGDLESLFRATANREAERIAALAVPIDVSMSLTDRIDAIVTQRCQILEAVTPVRRAALLQEPFSDELRAARDAFFVMGEQQVVELFAREIDAVPPARRDATRAAVSIALFWGFWNDLRTSGHSIAQSEAATREVLRAALEA